MSNMRKFVVRYFTFIFVAGTASGLILLIATPNAPDISLKDPTNRELLCIGFVIWGFIYYRAGETYWRALFGLAQIAAALGSNWYQLTKAATEGMKDHLYDRAVFVAAGIAVIAHGCKDISDGLKKWNERKLQKAKAPAK